MTINKGDIYGFIGKNGAGKTTLMRMILTLAVPTEGEIFLFGSNDLKEGCKRTGSLIETPAFPKNITATELLKRYSILYGADITKTNDILELVGLQNAGKKKIGQFSLGMKQRMGIAIALINNPEFLILDEPLNGLDPMGMKEIRDLILKLNKENGITFLISSHLLEELSKTATKIGIINDGILIEEKSMEDIVSACTERAVFKVDNVDKTVALLQDSPMVNEVVSEGNKVYVTCDSSVISDINKMLVTNAIKVSGIEAAGYNLENYYIKKVGEYNG